MRESKEITKCDLCGENLGIVHPNDTMRMVLGYGMLQAWPLLTGNVADICSKCCMVLDKAKRLGIIDYDEQKLIKMYTDVR